MAAGESKGLGSCAASVVTMTGKRKETGDGSKMRVVKRKIQSHALNGTVRLDRCLPASANCPTCARMELAVRQQEGANEDVWTKQTHSSHSIDEELFDQSDALRVSGERQEARGFVIPRRTRRTVVRQGRGGKR